MICIALQALFQNIFQVIELHSTRVGMTERIFAVAQQVGAKCISHIFVMNTFSQGTLCMGITKVQNVYYHPNCIVCK